MRRGCGTTTPGAPGCDYNVEFVRHEKGRGVVDTGRAGNMRFELAGRGALSLLLAGRPCCTATLPNGTNIAL